jgi:tRNA A-37 threonylcarbamoyl transferase component Bud32
MAQGAGHQGAGRGHRIQVQWTGIADEDRRRLAAVVARIDAQITHRTVTLLCMDPLAARYLEAVVGTHGATVVLIDAPGERLTLLPGGRLALVAKPWSDETVEEALLRVGKVQSEPHRRTVRQASQPTPRPSTSQAQKTTARKVRTASTARSLVGTLLDERYRIESVLGKGGFATVYKARHEVLGVPVAVKVLRSRALADRRSIDMLISEARSVAKVRHPNIVRILDAARSAKQVYVAMEFVDGASLAQTIADNERIAAAAALRFAAGVCRGLGAAHAQGIIHCDVKPSNIMIDRQETPLLVDFGLARPIAAAVAGAGGRFAGSPSYMAPEQASEGATLDHRTDIYGLGCTLYHALTGRPPYPGEDPIAILLAHVRNPVPDPRLVTPTLDAQAAMAVMAMMAKAPKDRPGDHLELAALLEDCALRCEPAPRTNRSGLFSRLWTR